MRGRKRVGGNKRWVYAVNDANDSALGTCTTGREIERERDKSMASNQRWHHDVAPSALPLTLAVALRLHIAISRMLSHSAALSIACAYTLSLDLLKARSLQGLLFLFRLAHRSHEVYSLTSLTTCTNKHATLLSHTAALSFDLLAPKRKPHRQAHTQ